MTTTQQKRVLPADAYDFLELSALAYGGIGAEAWADKGFSRPDVNQGIAAQCCLFGHASAGGDDPYTNEVTDALEAVGILLHENDVAVHAINARKHAGDNDRVSWDEYRAELNIVRGDA
jgi:hypothetical protein